MPHTYGQALRSAAERLRASGVPSPEWDARLMAAYLTHTGHMDIPLHEEPMPGFDVAYEALVARREHREPLQHVLGVAWFGSLELEVGPGVFIPRPETEVLAEWGVRQLRGMDSPLVVDLCTGSGALAAYIAHEAPNARVYAVELSDAAFSYAQRNLADSGVTLIQGDVTDLEILAELNGSVDLLVTNPPYVPETDDLEPEVYADPHEAVFSGTDGMTLIRQMVPTVSRLLKPRGRVGIEHDDTTSSLVQAALHDAGGFTAIKPLTDLTGTPRFVTALRDE
ncbi:peptide chain release factor N(5)-glutamine methyltransferase [Corynebacterium phoceense]|uniref:peptide chain release factor N(5)-glutamine methyltransferase n=1 Tax=Corynebacterium phoceense TaxID=1686286 RepID=UPI00211BAA01|nr:peptide chain release factor N(5)-glutamine methyltransferase [Corynebacterium phoceense]